MKHDRLLSYGASPNGSQRVVGMLIVLCSAGCLDNHATIKHSSKPLPLAEIYRNAKREFDNAVFYKPRGNDADRIEMMMAPLLVFEAEAEDGGLSNPFGAIIPARSGGTTIDLSQPAVYFSTGRVEFGGVAYGQLTYVWCMTSRSHQSIRMSGVRMTLAVDGFPMIWEVLDEHSERDLIFVSESLEAAAIEHYQSAQGGRRYTVERAVDVAPETVVVDVLPDGPMPMGPYVYLSIDRPTGWGDTKEEERIRIARSASCHSINAVVCRCSPSRVERFARDSMYDLLPMAALRAASAEIAAALDEMGLGDGELPLRNNKHQAGLAPSRRPEDLSSRLRLPPSTAPSR